MWKDMTSVKKKKRCDEKAGSENEKEPLEKEL